MNLFKFFFLVSSMVHFVEILTSVLLVLLEQNFLSFFHSVTHVLGVVWCLRLLYFRRFVTREHAIIACKILITF